MCCDNNCLFFIKMRTATLIFGYIAAVISAIGVLVSIIAIFIFATCMIVYNASYIVPLNIVEILFVEMVTGFIANVLLLLGIQQDKATFVKSYVIYAMIHFVLLLVVVIIITCITMPIIGILGLIGCVMYTLIIYMVYLTYKAMITQERRSCMDSPIIA